MPGTMRGVYTNLTEIRRKVFREVAKICYRMGEVYGVLELVLEDLRQLLLVLKEAVGELQA